jgi:hypothetical protein
MTYRRSKVLAAAAISVGLIISGCSRTEAPTASTASSPPTQSQAQSGGVDLKALVPTPAGTAKSKGPDAIADNGIHQYFQVDGGPNEVMNAFKAALEGKGWEVSTIVSSGGGPGGGGGATYTGTHGDAYGVFDGGGYQNSTYIDVCTWPAKPANPNCQRGTGR